MNQPLTWLALGDSYTIGEGCPIYDSYPYQTLRLLRKEGLQFNSPEIIAKTGWTTFELAGHINETVLNSSYTIVSLLIGVNNQYRGLPASQYSLEFEELLQKAINKAGNEPGHVFVLSVPDWGLTPFANGRDTAQISKETGLFNSINRKISMMHAVHYIDITTASPETSSDLSYLTGDGLHPSGKAYARWAEMLAEKIIVACGPLR
jgi:lysophospholipase L1-like esterase